MSQQHEEKPLRPEQKQDRQPGREGPMQPRPVSEGIRVTAVAPGPVWTPLIPATFPKEEIATFGSDVSMQRAGQPVEVAPCFVFLTSEDSSYMTGQVLHPNGGEIVNG